MTSPMLAETFICKKFYEEINQNKPKSCIEKSEKDIHSNESFDI